jgi:hypothetical protein
MKVNLLRTRNRDEKRRRANQIGLGVERMEDRALLAPLSAVVTFAIYDVQLAYLSGERTVSSDISTFKVNIQNIKDTTSTYISSMNSDILIQKQNAVKTPSTIVADKAAIAQDRLLIKMAIQAEKVAISQQNQAIKAMQHVGKDIKSTAGTEIKLLTKGKITPATAEAAIVTKTDLFTGRIDTITTNATANLDAFNAKLA